MRKFNTILTALIMILFLLHAVFGAMELVGAGYNALKIIARACFGLVVVHTIIGIKLTIDTLRVSRKTGVSYFRENRLFWARRISGLAVMILLCFHMFAFGKTTGGVYQLRPFTTVKLIAQIMLVLSIALHVLTNIRPALIAFGARGLKQHAGDILIVLSVVLLVFITAFIIYYLRWHAF